MAEQDQEDQDEMESEHDCHDTEYGLSGARRPMNAFFIFCKRHRDIVREKYPHLENRSITKILGEWWANLHPSEKSSYTTLAKQYKEAFMKANPDFKWYKIPTPPTRTLVTRPSNQRSLQTQKEKKKSSSWGITLGKLADDTQLGGLSSLINPITSIASSTNCHSSAIASSTSNVTSHTASPKNILKPPKKRYIINGEFRCQSESSFSKESRDHQTQNACSALLQLAGICANDEDQKVTSSPLDTSSKRDISGEHHTLRYDSVVPPFGTLISKSASESLLSHFPCDFEKLEDNHPISLNNQSVVLNSNNAEHNKIMQLEDQPLNLCKEKEKTFRTSNQQLIDHLVDKFLCNSPPHSGNHFISVLDPPFSQFLSSDTLHLNNLSPTKEKSLYTGFTLSDAIESAVDQAYSKDFANKNKTEKTDAIQDVSAATPNYISENTLKAESILDSKSSNKVNTESKEENTDAKSNEIKSKNILDVPHSISLKFSFSGKTEEKIRPTNTFISDKTGSFNEKKSNRLFCHRKKSRMWCDIFMNEQLKNHGSSDSDKKAPAGISSPVRRNSQRTCKGRRYQALITEGLLQSAKERKPSSVRKLLQSAERLKSKNSPDESNAILSISKKKRKKEFSEKNRTFCKPETDLNKYIFDLDEKIAALPKCDIEILNKRRKSALDIADTEIVDYSKYSLSSANSPTSIISKESGVCDDSDSPEQLYLSNEHCDFNNSSYTKSSGRFKTGSFDLERHIASLPKCDIEMLNKRKSKN